MQVIYADPGLHDGLGHHAGYCRFITGEFRSRGIEPIVLAFMSIQPQLKAELGAHAHFRAFSYFATDGDPFCGWLNAFYEVSDRICRGMHRVKADRDDLVYFNSVQAGVMMGVIQWLKELPADRIPHVVMEFATDPGVDLEPGPTGISLRPRDPRIDPRGTLYRFASRWIPKEAENRLHMVTYEVNASAAYSGLLGQPVGVLPFLQHATTECRSRVGARPVTVSVLGHQRTEKGYQLVPEFTRLLLQERSDIRILVHNGAPLQMPAAQQAMRELAAADARITLDERVADGAIWADLLRASDLIVCPYLPERYAVSYSAVMAEAIANAIPVVVPAGTALSRLLRECDNPGTMFEKFDATSIAMAVNRALADFDGFAQAAHQAAARWPERYGPRATVDAILATVDMPRSDHPRTITFG